MTRWFRMYECLLDDPKVQKLDPVLFKTWVNLLCLASRNDGVIPSIEDVAFSLRVEDDVARVRLNDLFDKGLLDTDDADNYTPHNWNARQYKSDKDVTAAERQRRKRDRDKDVTRDVTDMSQPPEQIQSRADTEQKEKTLVVPSATTTVENFDFDEFWKAYPPRLGDRGRKAALKAYKSAIKRASKPTILKGVQAYAAFCASEEKLNTPYVKLAASWLNQDGWTETYESFDPKLSKKMAALKAIEEHNAKSLNGDKTWD